MERADLDRQQVEPRLELAADDGLVLLDLASAAYAVSEAQRGKEVGLHHHDAEAVEVAYIFALEDDLGTVEVGYMTRAKLYAESAPRQEGHSEIHFVREGQETMRTDLVETLDYRTVMATVLRRV